MQYNVNSTVLKRIENLSSKLALYTVKNIILKEFKNPYYQNAAHISKRIDLNGTPIEEINGELAYHVKNLKIWDNGFVSFNDFYVTTPALKYSKRNIG